MKKFAVLLSIVLTLIGCGNGHKSPTSPSSSEPQPVDLSQKIYVNILRSSADRGYVQLYGPLGWGLSDDNRQKDLNGAMLRVRVFEPGTAKFQTFLVPVYNSTPIGNSNVTIVRDIPMTGDIDLTFTLEPYDCKDHGGAPGCWYHLEFPDASRRELLPANRYKLESRNNEVHLVGGLPPMQ